MKKIAALLVLAAGSAANAQTWAEVGDAGQTVATHQDTSGVGALTTITGSLSGGTDFDLYCIHLNGGAFSISATSMVGNDSVLALFNSAGTGLLYDDDISGGNFLSVLNGTAIPAGDYLLGVWAYTGVASALSAGGPIWNLTPFFPQRAPDGTGAAGTLTGFTGNHGQTGAYTILLDGASYCIPTPGAAALLGLGGLAMGRRRRA